MSRTLTRCVEQHSRATGSLRLLLWRLAALTDERDGFAYPSRANLSRQLNLTPRQVRRLVTAGVQLGELGHLPGLGSGNFSRYRIKCGDPEAHAKGTSLPPIERASATSIERGHLGTRKGTSVSAERGHGYARNGTSREKEREERRAREENDRPERVVDRSPSEAVAPVHDGRHGPSCNVCRPVLRAAAWGVGE